jgi:hypothetical protein
MRFKKKAGPPKTPGDPRPQDGALDSILQSTPEGANFVPEDGKMELMSFIKMSVDAGREEILIAICTMVPLRSHFVRKTGAVSTIDDRLGGQVLPPRTAPHRWQSRPLPRPMSRISERGPSEFLSVLLTEEESQSLE